MSEFIFRYRPWNMESEEWADYLAEVMAAFEEAFAEYEASRKDARLVAW